MIELESMNKCSGCASCALTCPQNCITMVLDKMGFYYPKVDTEQCIQCGLCRSRCPAYSGNASGDADHIAEAFAVVGKDEKIREISSSGGIFYFVARYIISQNGVIFGAAFDDNYHSVRHIAVDSPADLYKLQGAKYVQSEIGESYLSARFYLDQGKPVLFTGTPCQIAGLKTFLNKDYSNLYLLDIVCHGVPSPAVWNDYLTQLEKQYSGKVKCVAFRDKTNGWKNYLLRIEMDNGSVYSSDRINDLYMRGFLHNYYLRLSCYECNYKRIEHGADMTLGDFWGIENICPTLYDDKGTSLVIVSSPKGRLLFEQIQEKVCVQKVALDDVIPFNQSIVKSANYTLSRKKFENDFRLKPIMNVLKKHCSMSKYQSLKRKIKTRLNQK